MQVAYFADPLYQTPTAGGARYTVELARELARMPGVDLRLLTLYSPEEVAARVRAQNYPAAECLPVPLSRKAQYLLWHFAGLSGSLAKATQNADILHTPILIVPPKKRAPLVVTVFDLTFVSFPQHHLRSTRVLLGSGLRRAVQTADLFLAISENTKRDLVRLTGVAPERVCVTPLAADPLFRPSCDTGVPARLGIDRPYALYVGTLEPRKNVTALLQAFAQLEDKETLLVLAGAKGWMYEQIFSLVTQLGLESRVKMLGYVENDDLPALYTEAQVFVYPSLFEGFGLPVLEAMQCGTPVITTNVSSLPEVAGEAAILVSPDDTAGLTAALRRVLSEPNLREEMRGQSLARAALFSWRKTAEMTVEAYQSVLRGHR
jgi:glycosyltransferase involved in cell wall biosynthesis